MLQLGRGRSTAETSGIKLLQQGDSSASIGPRSIDRGNEAMFGCVSTLSMCFNWAAVDRPRKRLWPRWCQGVCIRFNWAAVDRPRKHLPRRAPGPVVFGLQLGRGRSTAETRPRSRAPAPRGLRFNWAAVDRPRKRASVEFRFVAHYLASIGPRSIDRGNSRADIERSPCPAASIGPRSIDRGNYASDKLTECWEIRFNWAAVDRPRKPGDLLACRTREAGLQLGRGRSTAETGHGRFDRAFDDWLQLGRGRSTAETCHPDRSPRSRLARFNWAAVDRPRKQDRKTQTRRIVNPASIGPRSIDRGNRRANGQPHRRPLRFNWAAVDRPRKRRKKIDKIIRFLCFNWAAVDRPRKLLWHRGRADRRANASIGPRSIDRGNMQHLRSMNGVHRCFNWAAVDRPRKRVNGMAPLRSSLSFNWAAVDRPRKQGLYWHFRRHELRFNWAAVDRPRKPLD